MRVDYTVDIVHIKNLQGLKVPVRERWSNMANSDQPHGRATRADVARLAKVSTAVVSYVFNNGPRNVSEPTAQKVREAARLLDYRPNSVARALRTGSSKTIGVIVPDLSNPFFSGVYSSLEAVAAREGYSTLFMASHQNAEKEMDRINKLIARDVDAILIASAQSASALSSVPRKECPFVFMDQTQAVPNAKCVSTDFQAAVGLAVRHLLGHGYRNIAMLSGKADDELSEKRIQGWYQAHKESGIPVGPIVQAHFTREGGYQATLALLRSGNVPDAIFADSDLEAIGALRALHEEGIRIPEDIAIVSFDGTIESLYTWPLLTVIRQDTEVIAERMFQAALHPEDTPDLQLIGTSLVPRQSCGCVEIQS